MSTLLLAEIFGISPVLVGAPEVAVGTVLLPALFALIAARS